MTQRIVDDIEELFNIGISTDTEESSDYNSTAEADSSKKASFDELAVEIGDSLGNASEGVLTLDVPKKIDPPQEIKVVETPKVVEETKPAMSTENLIRESITASPDEEESNINVDDIFTNSSSSQKENTVEDSNIKESGNTPATEVKSESPETVEVVDEQPP